MRRGGSRMDVLRRRLFSIIGGLNPSRLTWRRTVIGNQGIGTGLGRFGTLEPNIAGIRSRYCGITKREHSWRNSTSISALSLPTDMCQIQTCGRHDPWTRDSNARQYGADCYTEKRQSLSVLFFGSGKALLFGSPTLNVMSLIITMPTSFTPFSRLST